MMVCRVCGLGFVGFILGFLNLIWIWKWIGFGMARYRFVFVWFNSVIGFSFIWELIRYGIEFKGRSRIWI